MYPANICCAPIVWWAHITRMKEWMRLSLQNSHGLLAPQRINYNYGTVRATDTLRKIKRRQWLCQQWEEVRREVGEAELPRRNEIWSRFSWSLEVAGEEGHFRQRGQSMRSHGVWNSSCLALWVWFLRWRRGADQEQESRQEPSQGACVLKSPVAMLPHRVATSHMWLFKCKIIKSK